MSQLTPGGGPGSASHLANIIIEGGHPLSGRVPIGGAKNAALPAMAATLLTDDECVLDNVPDIDDIHVMTDILRAIGASVTFSGPNRVTICARGIHEHQPPAELVTRMRASFLVMGPLLARLGRVSLAQPGGCKIGKRPLDANIKALCSLAADIEDVDGAFQARTDGLKGNYICLDYPSHTGTENLLMAACLARGTTVIRNASAEPEVVDVVALLSSMGARIEGAGTHTIRVEGGERLHGANHRVLPDRLEAGTFLLAGAVSCGDVTVEKVVPQHFDILLFKLREAGLSVDEGASSVRVRGCAQPRSTDVQALPFPGFPTDLQAAFAVFLTQCRGVGRINERVFDARFGYAEPLERMGARVDLRGQVAAIEGPQRLRGATVRALDLRCGAALMLGGLVAEGVTEIEDVFHIERGYEGLDEKLASLGAAISRRGGGSA